MSSSFCACNLLFRNRFCLIDLCASSLSPASVILPARSCSCSPLLTSACTKFDRSIVLSYFDSSCFFVMRTACSPGDPCLISLRRSALLGYLLPSLPPLLYCVGFVSMMAQFLAEKMGMSGTQAPPLGAFHPRDEYCEGIDMFGAALSACTYKKGRIPHDEMSCGKSR